VMHSDVWRDAQSSGELHVEVPFAVLLEEGTGPFSSASVPDKVPVPFSADRSVTGATNGSVIPVAQGLSPASRDPGRTGSPEAGAVGRIPTVLRGVIDLVYRAADGWRIVDYKTDRVEGGVAELVERHGAQLGAYVHAWRTATGETPTRAGIFGVRDVQIRWKKGSPV
jgi:hypothetical protein